MEVHCRICLEVEDPARLLEPCGCRGTMLYVHKHCLETWRQHSQPDQCVTCGEQYRVPLPHISPLAHALWSNDEQYARRMFCLCAFAILLILTMLYVTYWANCLGPHGYNNGDPSDDNRPAFASYPDGRTSRPYGNNAHMNRECASFTIDYTISPDFQTVLEHQRL